VKSGTGVSTTYTLVSSYTGSTHENSRLYTGREYDRETNLYFLRARYYNPSTGKFISRDPVGQNDQINLYTYVANSPVMYTDPTGKFVFVASLIAGAASVILGAAVEAVTSYVTWEEFDYSLTDAAVDFGAWFIWAWIVQKAAQLTNVVAKVWTVLVSDIVLWIGSEIIKDPCGKNLSTWNIAQSAAIYGASSLLWQAWGRLIWKLMSNAWKKSSAWISTINSINANYNVWTSSKSNIVDVSESGIRNYAPDRKLPTTQHWEPIPDSMSAHTQLWKRDGRSWTYVQWREWWPDGELKKILTLQIMDVQKITQIHIFIQGQKIQQAELSKEIK
jgi:RHS repeat-associated protein